MWYTFFYNLTVADLYAGQDHLIELSGGFFSTYIFLLYQSKLSIITY